MKYEIPPIGSLWHRKLVTKNGRVFYSIIVILSIPKFCEETNVVRYRCMRKDGTMTDLQFADPFEFARVYTRIDVD